MEQCEDDSDIVMFSNDDDILHPMLPEEAIRHVAVHGTGSAHRIDWKKKEPPDLSIAPWLLSEDSDPHLGRDVFVFSRLWLRRHWNDIPDFLLGASHWDLCLAAMIRLEKGIGSTMENYYDAFNGCELPRGLVIHPWHKGAWEGKENAGSPSQTHNMRCFKEWFARHGQPDNYRRALEYDWPLTPMNPHRRP
jgi:hypothetical protein